MYFLRVDYIYRHTGVQRSRNLCKSFNEVLKIIDDFRRHNGVRILQVKIELCY